MNKKRPYRRLCECFTLSGVMYGLYFFILLISGRTFLSPAGPAQGYPGAISTCLCFLAAALGYSAVLMTCRFFNVSSARNPCIAAACAFFLIFFTVTAISPKNVLFTVCSALSSAFIGVTGGLLCFTVFPKISEAPSPGIVLSLPAAGAALIDAVIGIFPYCLWVNIAFTAVGTILLAVLMLRSSHNAACESSAFIPPFRDKAKESSGPCSVLAAALISLILFASFAPPDIIPTDRVLSGPLGGFLFMAGILAAGFMSRPGPQDPAVIAAVCLQLPLVLRSSLYDTNSSLCSCIFCFCAGFFLIFTDVMIVNTAGSPGFAAAAAGAASRAAMAIIFCLSPLLKIWPPLLPALICCLLSAILIILLWRRFSHPSHSPAASIQTEEEEYRRRFAERYRLTARETEVFEMLITTEDGIQEMADSLYMSRRTFQRYITSIYEKTGTKSRMGLYQAYIEAKNIIRK